MADLQSVVKIIFSGVDNLTETTNKVSKSVTDFADAGKNLTGPLADATSGVLKFEAGLVTAGAALALISANEAQKFETAFREIATLIDQPIENLQKFRGDILDYAQASTQSLDNIIKATYDAISAGVSYDHSLEQVRTSENLAVAGKAELADANRILLQVLSAYADSNITAEEAAAKLFAVVRTGVTTLPELSASLGGVIDIAAKGGVPLDELLAAIASLTKTQDSAESVTALKGVITAIISPSEEAKKATQDLGIEFSAASLKSNGLLGVLQLLLKATDGNVDKIAALFGNVRGLSGVLGLASENGELFRQNIEAQKNAIDPYKEAIIKMSAVLDTGVDNIKVLAIQLGGPLLEAFYNSKGAITEIINTIADGFLPGGALEPIAETLEKFGIEIEDTFKEVQKNIPAALEGVDFSGFLGALENLWSTVGDILNVDDLQTEEGLKNFIQTLVDLLERTTVYSESALTSIGPFVQKIGDFVKLLSEIDPEQIGLIGEIGGYALAANVGFSALSSTLLILTGSGGILTTVSGVFAALKSETLLAAAAITGPLGIAVAFGVAAGAIAQFLIPADKLADWSWPDWLAGYEGASFGTAVADIGDGFVALKDDIEKFLGIADKVPDSIKPVKIPVGQFDGAISEIARYEAESASANDEYIKLVNFLAKPIPVASYDGILAQLSNIDYKTKDANDSTKKYIGTLEGLPELKLPDNVKVEQYRTNIEGVVAINGALVTSYSSLDGKTVKATGAFASISTAAEDNANKVEKAKKEADSFRIKMEEIASNERIKNIEAYVSLNVADLEAQAKMVESTFASIDNTVSSTGDLLGSLFGGLSSADTYSRLKIESQIDLENKRRDAALELQKKLTQAEIDNINAKTRALDRGDSLIKIDGTGLEPQLEAFMWEILKAVRVRVNADFADYLLGAT